MDTNVFIALFSGEEEASASAQAALEEAWAAGPLVISPAVYSELVAGKDASFVERFLSRRRVLRWTGIRTRTPGELQECATVRVCQDPPPAKRRYRSQAHPGRLP